MNEVPDVDATYPSPRDWAEVKNEVKSGHQPQLLLPSTLIGHTVIAAVTMENRESLLPRRHIVVLHNSSRPENRAYSTHYVAYQLGTGWVLNYGHYDLDRNDALQDLIDRERLER